MLRILSLSLGILTLAVCALGAVSLLFLVRAAGTSALWGYGWWVLTNPVVILAAVMAVGLSVAARMTERRRPLEPIRRQARTLDLDLVDPAALAPGAVTSSEAVAASRRARDQLRVRLEALLQGKPDMIAFIDELLAGAIRRGASDVHLQPLETATRISFRVQGMLEEVASLPEVHHQQMVRRLKVLAELVPYQTEKPQDGHFTLATPLGAVDVRISVVPTHHGEKVVLRLLLAAAGLHELDRLGITDEQRASLLELLGEPQGLVVLTGPTGSGKTTTLYAALAAIRQARGQTATIATIEDPIEVDLPFLNQTQVDRSQGLTFAAGLRALLRQDPNVLMVGEIRDGETAEIAVRAGLTGHLILSTLHADSAAGVFARLIDAGVEPFLVASATLAGLSQRLVRRLCPECRRPARVSRPMAARLVEREVAIDGLGFFQSDGCAACERSGRHGRMAIFEILRMTPSLRRLITSRVPTDQIEAAAVGEGMTPLVQAAVAAAAGGHVSLDEALGVVP